MCPLLKQYLVGECKFHWGLVPCYVHPSCCCSWVPVLVVVMVHGFHGVLTAVPRERGFHLQGKGSPAKRNYRCKTLRGADGKKFRNSLAAQSSHRLAQQSTSVRSKTANACFTKLTFDEKACYVCLHMTKGPLTPCNFYSHDPDGLPSISKYLLRPPPKA